MKYDVDYFIEKFSAIPEEKWFTGWLVSDDNTKRCALGHCCPDYNQPGFFKGVGQTEESKALMWILSDNAATINDGDHANYQQPTPKQRILAALRDVKKLQDTMISDTTDERSVASKDDQGTERWPNKSLEISLLPLVEEKVDMEIVKV